MVWYMLGTALISVLPGPAIETNQFDYITLTNIHMLIPGMSLQNLYPTVQHETLVVKSWMDQCPKIDKTLAEYCAG